MAYLMKKQPLGEDVACEPKFGVNPRTGILFEEEACKPGFGVGPRTQGGVGPDDLPGPHHPGVELPCCWN